MEAFFRTHKYLIEHMEVPVRRLLMDEIDWEQRLIGIKGSRGVGKTTFLLDYARRNFGTDRSCLYVNLNNFYFTGQTLVNFADKFRMNGGKTLLIDQIFKYPNWSKELRYCYDNFKDLKIVFTGSSIMRLKEENPDLAGCVDSYILRGFSLREFINLTAGTDLKHYKLDDILKNHKQIVNDILKVVKPFTYFQDYLHHGYYPFFLEKKNYSENLLKTINITLEIDILLLKQIELSYLPKIRKLLYLLASNEPAAPNISQLSLDIQTSRATVMNYIKYLKDARMLNILYPKDENFPKKPSKVYLQNTNLMYAFWPALVSEQAVRETFFYNSLIRDHKVNKGEKNAQFLIDGEHNFCIVNK
ncbi:MAG: AAA family ATPase, partial [Paludibacteraceae bacterium]|nr:AAA family ATPase [Paludibacteraceae bacterium]